MELDGKSIIFFITFVVSGILVLLAVHAMSFQNLPITTPRVYMDFIFAGILAILAVVQYKIIETTEKA